MIADLLQAKLLGQEFDAPVIIRSIFQLERI